MEPEAGTGSEDRDSSDVEPGHVAPEHEAPELEPPERRPEERTYTLGDVQRALRISVARPKLTGRAKPGIRSWRGRSSRAAAAGARCCSRAHVAGWRGRWQCTSPRRVNRGAPATAKSISKYLGQVRLWHLEEFRTEIIGELDLSQLKAVVKGIARCDRWSVRTQDLAKAIEQCLHPQSAAGLTAAFCGLLRGAEFALHKEGEAFDSIRLESSLDVGGRQVLPELGWGGVCDACVPPRRQAPRRRCRSSWAEGARCSTR